MRRVALDVGLSTSKHATDNQLGELDRMSRRKFIALAMAGSGAWPFTALAQQQWSESVLAPTPAGLIAGCRQHRHVKRDHADKRTKIGDVNISKAAPSTKPRT
jgi:hypothetical protein